VPGFRSRDQRAFVEVLVALRKRKGLTQREVADRAGKPHSYISKTEAFQRIVKLADIPVFALGLGMAEDRLYRRYMRWRDGP
jgi:transcriptional regulator with XRE-family HTH domain